MHGYDVVYKRIDADGNVYIGQAKSKERFIKRMKEHDKKFSDTD